MAGNSFSFDSESNSIVRANGNGEEFAGEIIGTSNENSGNTSGNGSAFSSGGSEVSGSGEIPKKKRGRKAYPRDAEGNIIRPEGEENSGVQKKEKLALGFIKNDKVKIRLQIQGIHAAVAVLTKQPVLMLNDNEATALSNSLCDVLDYHNINLTQAGGQYGLYMTLIVTVFGIYKPRIDAIKSGANINAGISASAPTSPGEMRRATGTIDLSGDIASMIN